MRVFELEDVIHLLRAEVKRAGGQVAWSKRLASIELDTHEHPITKRAAVLA
jgi:hypothetical protein